MGPFLFAGISIIVILAIFLVCVSVRDKVCLGIFERIKELGFKDPEEVQIFCLRIGASLEDFIASKGLQKQYLRFARGEDTEFIRKAEAHKDSEEAKAAASSAQAMAVIAITRPNMNL